MEDVSRLPDGLKIRGGSLKYVLREAFRDLLPAEIRTRPTEYVETQILDRLDMSSTDLEPFAASLRRT